MLPTVIPVEKRCQDDASTCDNAEGKTGVRAPLDVSEDRFGKRKGYRERKGAPRGGWHAQAESAGMFSPRLSSSPEPACLRFA